MAPFDAERYSRQVALRLIGPRGQRRIREGRVAIAGIGGLGSISAIQLASMGVGYLRLVDHDFVELSNLQRQPLYDTYSLGEPKVEVAERRLRALNPDVEIEALPLTISRGTAEEVVRDVDVVVDGLDRLLPRYAINEACNGLGIPYVFGSAIEAHGSVSTIVPGETACLGCIFGPGSDADEGLPTCDAVGVLPPILSAVASLQVREALSILLGEKPSLAGKLLFLDISGPVDLRILDVERSPNCPLCGSARRTEPKGPRLTRLCGGGFMIEPEGRIELDLASAARILGDSFRIRIGAKYGIVLEGDGGISISLTKTGSALVRGASDEADALRAYEELMVLIREGGKRAGPGEYRYSERDH
ncbi:MAG: HesA/MoeB/ThiF family protein [Candidatus Bathyarchaeia archaeon]